MLHFGSSHHNDSDSLAWRNLYLNLPTIELQDVEQAVMQSHAKYNLPLDTTTTRSTYVSGGLVLTNKRLIFYFFDFMPWNPLKYEISFDCPLRAITGVNYRSPWGESLLEVDIDTYMITGLPHHEFLIIGAKKFYDAIREIRQDLQHTMDRDVEPLPAPEEHHDKRFSKVCLSCMKAIPEDSKVCPKCGTPCEPQRP